MKYFKILSMVIVPVLLLAAFVFLKTQSASYKVYVIHTGSMSPNIPSGSAVLVHEGHYRIGQVVTYTEQGLTVTHRLQSISSLGLITTKGDANPTSDPWHPPKSSIIGGVVVAPRYIGYWIMYFKNPLGLGSLALAVLAIWQLWALGDETSTESPDDGGPTKSSPSRSRLRRLIPSLTMSARSRASKAPSPVSPYESLFGKADPTHRALHDMRIE